MIIVLSGFFSRVVSSSKQCSRLNANLVVIIRQKVGLAGISIVVFFMHRQTLV
jgi:hypothetical protein